MGKERADLALVNRGLVESRAKAQALILAGKVFSAEMRVEKAGQPIKDDQPLDVRGADHPWASRGGLKLARAVERFGINFSDKIVIDVGASTGGFTDVALAHGAAKVYAVDVGHGQLAWRLRQDPRVVVLEKTNARFLTAEDIPDAADLVVCDASFIGLEKVLPAPLSLTAERASCVALIKPQFEVGKDQVGKGGVVRDPNLHRLACENIENWLDSLPYWQVDGIVESPIKGPEGNAEFLIHAVKSGAK